MMERKDTNSQIVNKVYTDQSDAWRLLKILLKIFERFEEYSKADYCKEIRDTLRKFENMSENEKRKKEIFWGIIDHSFPNQRDSSYWNHEVKEWNCENDRFYPVRSNWVFRSNKLDPEEMDSPYNTYEWLCLCEVISGESGKYINERSVKTIQIQKKDWEIVLRMFQYEKARDKLSVIRSSLSDMIEDMEDVQTLTERVQDFEAVAEKLQQIQMETDREMNILRAKLDELKCQGEELEALKKQIKDFNEEAEADAQDETAKVLLQKLSEEAENISGKISKLRAANQGMKLEYGWLRELEVLMELAEEGEKQSDIQIDTTCSKSFDNVVEYVWSQMWYGQELKYDRSVIRQYLSALTSGQMILLWGQPGTGKTSLSEAVAKAVGGKCKTIPVQPNWTDNQDLLGYYNTVDMRYSPTVFLDALVEAKNDPDRLHLIVLDEMNLAHVEYYFSEVLSSLSSGKEKTLNLYSRSLKAELEKRASGLLAQCREHEENDSGQEQKDDAESTKEEHALNSEMKRVCGQLQEMNIYEPVFSIPENVRFVGTLNMDGTTKDISPKVRDRSYIIEVEKYSGLEPKQKKEPKHMDICAGYFAPFTSEHASQDLKEKLEKALVRLRMELPYELLENEGISEEDQPAEDDGRVQETIPQYLGISLSHRYDMQVSLLVCGYHIKSLLKKGIQYDWSDDESEDIRREIRDDILLCKVLPNLEISRSEDEDSVYKRVEKLCELDETSDFWSDYKRSARKLKQMYDIAAKDRISTYWSTMG